MVMPWRTRSNEVRGSQAAGLESLGVVYHDVKKVAYIAIAIVQEGFMVKSWQGEEVYGIWAVSVNMLNAPEVLLKGSNGGDITVHV